MKKTLVSAVVLAACMPAFAQSSKDITIPDGFLKKEGNRYAYGLSYYSGAGSNGPATAQLLEAEMQDRNTRVLRAMMLRHDSTFTYSSFTGVGRTWSNVTMSLGKGVRDAQQLDRTYSKNYNGKMTQVFSGTVTWPTITGRPTVNNPAAWGDLRGGLAFTFKSVHVHLGQDPLLAEFEFTNGRLANNSTFWTGSRSSIYYVDGEFVSTSSTSSTFVGYVPSTRINCNDTGMTRTLGAYTYMYGTSYGKGYTIINYQGETWLQSYAYYAFPNRGMPVIRVISTAGSTNGVNIGARCNRLHVSLTAPNVFVTHSSVGNTSGYSGNYILRQKTNPLLADLELWGQTAWADSKTGAFSLTQAIRTRLPNPPVDKLPARWFNHRWNSTSPTANISTNSTFWIPIIFWDHR